MRSVEDLSVAGNGVRWATSLHSEGERRLLETLEEDVTEIRERSQQEGIEMCDMTPLLLLCSDIHLSGSLVDTSEGLNCI